MSIFLFFRDRQINHTDELYKGDADKKRIEEETAYIINSLLIEIIVL